MTKTTLLITDPAQIAEAWAALDVQDSAQRAGALPVQAQAAYDDLKRLHEVLRVLVTPLISEDGRAVLDRYFEQADARAAALAAIPEQASVVLTHAAGLLMQTMAQRNAKTAELGALIEALERGDTTNPLIQRFAAALDASDLETVIDKLIAMWEAHTGKTVVVSLAQGQGA